MPSPRARLRLSGGRKKPAGIGVAAGARAGVENDGARPLFLKLLVDLPDQLLALRNIGLHRLLAEQLLDILVAVIGVVPLRIAGIVLVKRLVGIVDRISGEVEAERIILARNFREPVG